MARYAYVNGRYVDHREAMVHVEDRGYQLADGVYEVVGVRDGRLIDEAPHIDRLDRSLSELRIAWPVSRATLGFIIRELMRRNRLTRDTLDWLVPHQANTRIIEAVGRRLGLAPERTILTIERHANTSAASIPLALDAAVGDGRIRPGHLVLLEALGGGLTWGASVVRW